jgi:hypothetical protein
MENTQERVNIFDELSQQLAEAEKRLKSLTINKRDLWLPTYDGLGSIGFAKVNGEWHIAHAHLDGIKKISECSIAIRAHAARHIRSLHYEILKVNEKVIEEVKEAIDMLKKYNEGEGL